MSLSNIRTNATCIEKEYMFSVMLIQAVEISNGLSGLKKKIN